MSNFDDYFVHNADKYDKRVYIYIYVILKFLSHLLKSIQLLTKTIIGVPSANSAEKSVFKKFHSILFNVYSHIHCR